MENGCRIADAMNTYNIALRIIKAKGYKMFLYPDPREEFFGDFWAIKGNRQFIGGDPLRLLGVISIWEHTGDNWQYNDYPEEDLYDEILSRALPDSVEDISSLTDKEFKNLVDDYRLFFEKVLDKPFPENPSRQIMFDSINGYWKEECEE